MENEDSSQPIEETQAVETQNIVWKTYQTQDGLTQINVSFEGETIWLTQQQIADLFQTTFQNVSLHIQNAYAEGELDAESTFKESLIVAGDGKRRVVKFYNEDVVMSVGYRVKSNRGREFRIWLREKVKEIRRQDRPYGIPLADWVQMFLKARTGEVQNYILSIVGPGRLGVSNHRESKSGSMPVDVVKFWTDMAVLILKPVAAQWFAAEVINGGQPGSEWYLVSMAASEVCLLFVEEFAAQYPHVKQKDIQAALKAEPEWVPGSHTNRMGSEGYGSVCKCWEFRARADGNAALYALAKTIYQKQQPNYGKEPINEPGAEPSSGES